jgi:hypothetical protein
VHATVHHIFAQPDPMIREQGPGAFSQRPGQSWGLCSACSKSTFRSTVNIQCTLTRNVELMSLPQHTIKHCSGGAYAQVESQMTCSSNILLFPRSPCSSSRPTLQML